MPNNTLLTRLEELLAKGSPGPWRNGTPNICCKLDHRPHGQGQCEYRHHGWTESSDVYEDRLYAGTDDRTDGVIAGMWDYEEGGVKKEEDAALIAELHNAAPALIAIARAAQEVEQARSLTVLHQKIEALRSALADLEGK